MWWIIGIGIVIFIIINIGKFIIDLLIGSSGLLLESGGLLSKIILFTVFLIILGIITSRFFAFMGVVAELSGVVLVISLIVLIFKKIFVN